MAAGEVVGNMFAKSFPNMFIMSLSRSAVEEVEGSKEDKFSEELLNIGSSCKGQ